MDSLGVRLQIGQNLAFLNSTPIEIPVNAIDPSISDADAEVLRSRAEKLIDKSITLKFEYQTFVYKGGDLFEYLGAPDGYNEEKIAELTSSLANQINRPASDPVFVFAEGRVKEFEPSKDGVTVNESELNNRIVAGLKTLEAEEETSLTFDIPAAKTPPKISTGDVNNLGIQELIGRGSSRFRGSITNRIHNITLAASKFKGVLVAPGEVMSFNQVLGDVSEITGFRQAYIIKEGKTVLGDGGGVCQVSTTLFRAILNAGLPVLERQAHAYRVGYYEQDSPPGLDATVFAPSPDLKFRNDTPGHILIQSAVDTKTATLVFEIYGTSDGRIATTTKPVISAQVAPPEDLYIDDPTLPAGTVKQTEYKAWGAKITFNYTVTRGGEEIYKKTFVSNYRPWQAVYLRGTGPTQ
jgi:vancomycin resistance protein YoaR